jgi:phosphonate transport system ATP-binding protein
MDVSHCARIMRPYRCSVERAAMSVITIRGLNKSFGTRKALDGVSLDIQAGEMVALIGASGSGKSTLLRHVSGLTLGERGCVEVGGQRVQHDGRITRGIRSVRSHTGFVFQQFNLVARLPLITNVMTGMLHRVPLWRSLAGRFTREEIRLGMEALNRVGMLEYAWQRASTLSGGQQQRGAIARTLVQGARAILADEPIASLDPESSRRVMEILATINREDGSTVVVSLHQVEFARQFCPRIVALRQGQVVYDGAAAALSNQRLAEIYGAEVDQLFAPPPAAAPQSVRVPFAVAERAAA